MATFKCDICGGDIVMQANKTGICKQCGMEYNIEAIKDMLNHNNMPQESKVEEKVLASNNSTKDEIDRETLISYFYNLRVLESLFHKSALTIKELNERAEANSKIVIDNLNDFNDAKRELSDLEKKVIPEIQSLKSLILILLFFALLCTSSIQFFKDGSTTGIGIGIFVIICIAINAIVEICKYIKNKSQEKLMKTELSNKIMRYQGIVKRQEEKYENSREHKDEEYNKIKQLKSNIEEELHSIKDNLEEAYSINIIPQPFRNIEGVFYLYEYLASSDQSLSEALMQANLEAIKQRMDNVIRLQSVQIIQQAQANAKLNTIISNTEEIANNSALSAKYSIITSVNTALTNMLMSKSLAYQKAEFFLK